MKIYSYMNTIPMAKKIIRFAAVIYALFIIILTIILRRFDDFSNFTRFAKFAYIIIPIIMIILVILLFVREIKGSVLSIFFTTAYNIISLFSQSIRDLEIQMNLFFVFGALILFLHFFEKTIKSEQVDYQILMSRYEQLKFNAQITKSMAEITPEMLINDNLDELLQKILEKAVQLIPKAQSGSILIRNADKMEFKAAVGYNLDSLKKIKLHFEDMYQYKLGVLDEPAVVRDIRTFNEKNLKAETSKDMMDKNVLTAKAVLTCSFILKDTLYGFINLDNLEDVDAFSDQDKVYIKHFASQIEIALNNHLLIEQVYNLSRYDTLTGVNSRIYHETLIKDLMKESRDKNKKFSVVVMDINFLKEVNDTYGHHVGDQYLIHFTTTIKENMGKNDIFSRTGGDEFVLIIPNSNLDQGTLMVKKIREMAKQRPFIHNHVEHIIEFGCGVVSYPEDGNELIELTRIADQRMYEDKRLKKKSTL